MTDYRDEYPHNIEAPQRVYIQYSYDIGYDYSNGTYPDGDEDAWIWEPIYIPIEHSVDGQVVGKHEWMRVRVGVNSQWSLPIRISASITNIETLRVDVESSDTEFEFTVIITLADGTELASDPIIMRDGEDGTKIETAEINVGGDLIMTYDDGTVINAGRARGLDAVSEIPPAVDDDWLLSQSGGVILWVDPSQVLGNLIQAQLPITFNVVTGDLGHSDASGYLHVPTGGTVGQVLSTDGADNYSWIDAANISTLEEVLTAGSILSSTHAIEAGNNTLAINKTVGDYTFSLDFGAINTALRHTGLSANASAFELSGVNAVMSFTETGGTSQSIGLMNVTGITVIDAIASIGMRYSADYAAQNVGEDRWIPDKAYVDSVAVTPNLDTVLAQGGSFTTNRTIDAGNFDFNFINLNTYAIWTTNGDWTHYYNVFDYQSTGLQQSTSNGTTGQEIRVRMRGDYEIMASYNSGAAYFRMDETNSFIITDGINSTGMKYFADYSAAGILNDRWIPDYGAVKAYADSVATSYTFTSGLTNTAEVITLGGSLTAYTSIASGPFGIDLTSDGSALTVGSDSLTIYTAGSAVAVELSTTADSITMATSGGEGLLLDGDNSIIVANGQTRIEGSSLHVQQASSGGAMIANTALLIEHDATTSNIQFLGSDDSIQNVYFGTASDVNNFYMQANHDTDEFKIVHNLAVITIDNNRITFNDGSSSYDFRIEGDTIEDLFYVDASTDRVGIGTQSPGGLLGLSNGNTYLDVDGSTNLTFTDAVTGTKTLAELADTPTPNIDAVLAEGGDLSDDRAITIADNSSWFQVVASRPAYSQQIVMNATQINQVVTGGLGYRGRTQVGDGTFTADVYNGFSATSLAMTLSATTFTDAMNTKGIEYAADYGANADDRTIIDKGNVLQIHPLRVGDFNSVGGSGVLDNDAAYSRFYVRNDRTISTIRLLIESSTTTNNITAKLYDNSGSEITNAVGTAAAVIDTDPYTLDISLTASTALTENTLYWIAIYQATGGGTSIMNESSQTSDFAWNFVYLDDALGATVPIAGQTSFSARVCAELF